MGRGAGGGSPERTYAVDRDAAIRSMDAASAADVSRYVMLSYFGAGPDHGVPEANSFFTYADAKTAADTHLQESGLDSTVARPSRLTDDPSTGRIRSPPDRRGVVVGAARQRRLRVIAEALDRPSTEVAVIEFDTSAAPRRRGARSVRRLIR